jgi:hypothetical protein
MYRRVVVEDSTSLALNLVEVRSGASFLLCVTATTLVSVINRCSNALSLALRSACALSWSPRLSARRKTQPIALPTNSATHTTQVKWMRKPGVTSLFISAIIAEKAAAETTIIVMTGLASFVRSGTRIGVAI